MKRRNLAPMGVATFGFVLSLCQWCLGGGASHASSAKLEVIPQQVILTPGLLKEPVKFRGEGFAPGEMVIVEMILPPDVEIKGVKQGEDVGLAYANADNEGRFEVPMAPTATLNWFFQTEWSPILAPDLKQAKPIPARAYEVRATGLESGAVARGTLQIQHPTKEK